MSTRQGKPQSGDLESLATELHSVAIHLLRRARQDDASFGLSAARLSALSVLVFGGPQRLTRLAQVEQVKPPTMTRMVQGMERDGLVRVDVDPRDARARNICATSKGRRLLEQARRARVAHLRRVVARASASEARQIERTTATLRRLLSQDSS